MEKAFKIAKAELGYQSEDGISKYFEELFPEEHPMPYCLPFIEWVFVKAYGEEKAKSMLHMEEGFLYSVPAFLAIVKREGKFSRREAQVGWIVFLRTRQEWTNHVELITDVTGAEVSTIGGNCGAEVRANTYQRNDPRVYGYAKIIYGTEDTGCTA